MTAFKVWGASCNSCGALILSPVSGDDPQPLIDKMTAEGWRYRHADRKAPRVDRCPDCAHEAQA